VEKTRHGKRRCQVGPALQNTVNPATPARNFGESPGFDSVMQICCTTSPEVPA